MQHRHIGGQTRIDADIFEQTVERDARLADADAERALIVVNAHRDHRTVETLVHHARHRQQEPSGQILRRARVHEGLSAISGRFRRARTGADAALGP
jgi:hypothetical protein